MASNKSIDSVLSQLTSIETKLVKSDENDFVGQQIKQLFDNKHMSDVVFKFGSNHTLLAHKLILSLNSTVFHQQYYGSDCNSNVVQVFVNDFDYNSFKSVVKYLYTNEVDVNDKNVLPLMRISKRYEINCLVNNCLQFIVSKLNDTNCLKWWVQLKRHSCGSAQESKAIEKCVEMIANNAVQVLKTHKVINLSINELIELFSRNDLNITEYELFNTALRWSSQECVRRQIQINDKNFRLCLGSAFGLIRFPLMTSEEFGKIVADNPEIFEHKELAQLISCINSGIVFDSMAFEIRPRVPVCGEAIIPLNCRCLPKALNQNLCNERYIYCMNPYVYNNQIHRNSFALLTLPNCQQVFNSGPPALPPCMAPLQAIMNTTLSPNRSSAVNREMTRVCKLESERLERQDSSGVKRVDIIDPKTGKAVTLEELAKKEVGSDKLAKTQKSYTINSQTILKPMRRPLTLVSPTKDNDSAQITSAKRLDSDNQVVVHLDTNKNIGVQNESNVSVKTENQSNESTNNESKGQYLKVDYINVKKSNDELKFQIMNSVVKNDSVINVSKDASNDEKKSESSYRAMSVENRSGYEEWDLSCDKLSENESAIDGNHYITQCIDNKRITYSRDFLLSLREEFLTHEMKIRLRRVYDHFNDIFRFNCYFSQ